VVSIDLFCRMISIQKVCNFSADRAVEARLNANRDSYAPFQARRR
jgi:hypothetical protein